MAKVTRTDYVFNSNGKRPKRITYSDVKKGIQAGAIAVYFKDGKVLIDEDEADAYFIEKIREKLSALKAAEKVNLFT
jgi:hypothetical protein